MARSEVNAKEFIARLAEHIQSNEHQLLASNQPLVLYSQKYSFFLFYFHFIFSKFLFFFLLNLNLFLLGTDFLIFH